MCQILNGGCHKDVVNMVPNFLHIYFAFLPFYLLAFKYKFVAIIPSYDPQTKDEIQAHI